MSTLDRAALFRTLRTEYQNAFREGPWARLWYGRLSNGKQTWDRDLKGPPDPTWQAPPFPTERGWYSENSEVCEVAFLYGSVNFILRLEELAKAAGMALPDHLVPSTPLAPFDGPVSRRVDHCGRWLLFITDYFARLPLTSLNACRNMPEWFTAGWCHSSPVSEPLASLIVIDQFNLCDATLNPDPLSRHSGQKQRQSGASVLPLHPVWHAREKELRLGPQPIKQYDRPAPNQEAILSAFQWARWAPRVKSPLPYPQTRAVLGDLNSALRPWLHFQCNHRREFIMWSFFHDRQKL